MTFIPNVYGILSSNNSTSTPLGISGVFTGTSDSVLDYNSITVSVYTDQTSVTSGLNIQFSTDNVNWDLTNSEYIAAGKPRSHTFTVLAQYFRIVYTNGSVAQTVFRLQSILSNGKAQSESVENTTNGTLSTFTNVRLIGQNIDTTLNKVAYVSVDSQGQLLTRISEPRTAFGDLAVAQGVVQDTLSFQYNINTAIVSTTIVGTGSVTKLLNKSLVATGTTTASSASLRSLRQVNYIPGVGINIKFTAIFSTPVAGTTIFAGFGTPTSGFYFAYNGTQFSVCSRSESTNTFVSQSNWNLDTLDGNGPSNMILNTLFGNVFKIQFQWLGFGSIKFFVENQETGLFLPVHIIKFSNTSTSTSINNPNGYLRLESNNGATTSNVFVQSPSMSVKYESIPNKNIGVRFSISNTSSIVANTRQSILTIRNKQLFQTVANFVPISLQFVSVATIGNKPVRIDVVYNQTNATLIYTDISINQSVIEFSTTVATITTGQTIQSFYLGASDSKTIDYNAIDYVLSPADNISFVAFSTSGTNDNSISVSWIERF